MSGFGPLIGAGVDSAPDAISVQDEGAVLGNATVINFVGNGVTAAVGGGTATVTIPGGVSSSEHKALRHLIHFIDQGPGDGFASGAYKEQLPTGNPLPTSAIWWESSAKTQKIVEQIVTYTGARIATSQWKMYDEDGVTVNATVTDTFAYSGAVESTRTRAIA